MVPQWQNVTKWDDPPSRNTRGLYDPNIQVPAGKSPQKQPTKQRPNESPVDGWSSAILMNPWERLKTADSKQLLVPPWNPILQKKSPSPIYSCWWFHQFPSKKEYIYIYNVVKTEIDHPIFDGLYNPFMFFFWMVYCYCFNYITYGWIKTYYFLWGNQTFVLQPNL